MYEYGHDMKAKKHDLIALRVFDQREKELYLIRDTNSPKGVLLNTF